MGVSLATCRACQNIGGGYVSLTGLFMMKYVFLCLMVECLAANAPGRVCILPQAFSGFMRFSQLHGNFQAQE